MLIFVSKAPRTGGFFLRRQAKKGKLPPVITGCTVAGYPCVHLQLHGHISPSNPFLTPYLQRGDTLVAHSELTHRLPFNPPLIHAYKQRQCVNFCLEAIRRGQYSQAALVDPAGNCVGVAAELAAVCNTLWVVTHQPELFFPCSDYTWEMYGTRPLLTETLPTVKLIIAPDGMAEITPPPHAITAAPDGTLFPRDEDVFIPRSVLGSSLPGFSPLWVTAGLFSCFYPKELMESVPRQIHLGDTPISPERL